MLDKSGEIISCDNVGLWKTTYSNTYDYSDADSFKPPKKYHQLPSIESPGKNWVESRKMLPGYIPKLMYCRPPGHIHNAPQALGLGTFTNPQLAKNDKMKPIQRSVQPSKYRELMFKNLDNGNLSINKTREQESKFNYHNLVIKNRNKGAGISTGTIKKLKDGDYDLLKGIYNQGVYISSTERSHLQSAIPMDHNKIVGTDLEKLSDNVRYKAIRYNPNVEPWQQFSAKWDQVQLRKLTDTTTNQDTCKSFLTYHQPKESKAIENDKRANVSLVAHSGDRQLPGYSGYVPRLPIIKESWYENNSKEKCYCHQKGHIAKIIENDKESTTMRRAYPKYEFDKVPKSSYCPKKCPMSKMVTLVSPHNPFRLLNC